MVNNPTHRSLFSFTKHAIHPSYFHNNVITLCLHTCTRSFIWRCLLRLPENHTAYSSLLERGTHPSYLQLHQTYPIKSRKLLRVLQRYCIHRSATKCTVGQRSLPPVLLGGRESEREREGEEDGEREREREGE